LPGGAAFLLETLICYYQRGKPVGLVFNNPHTLLLHCHNRVWVLAPMLVPMLDPMFETTKN